MRKRLLTVVFVSVLGIAAIVGLRADSSARGPTFANNILNGRYSFHEEGSFNQIYDGGDFDQAFDDVGVATFNGNGGLAGNGTITFRIPSTPAPGFVCNFKFSGTYSVNPDGTGTTDVNATATSGICGKWHITTAFVLNSASGNAFSAVWTSFETEPTNIINNLVGSGEFTKQ